MNKDNIRHRTLQELYSKYNPLTHQLSETKTDVDDIIKKLNLNITNEQFRMICTELVISDDVRINPKDKKWFIELWSNGINSFGNEKYLNAKWRKRKERWEVGAKFVYPLIAIILTGITIFMKNDSGRKYYIQQGQEAPYSKISSKPDTPRISNPIKKSSDPYPSTPR